MSQHSFSADKAVAEAHRAGPMLMQRKEGTQAVHPIGGLLTGSDHIYSSGVSV
jgi:hypothetical protein